MPSPTAQRIELEALCRRCGASWQCTTWAERKPAMDEVFAGCPLCLEPEDSLIHYVIAVGREASRIVRAYGGERFGLIADQFDATYDEVEAGL